MKIINLIALLLLLNITSIAQKIDSSNARKTNPLIFLDAIFGGGSHGINAGGNLTYQVNQHLITTRVMFASEGEHGYTPPPVAHSPEYREFGILYGQSINNISASFGASYNKRHQLSFTEQETMTHNSSYIGFPWEVNITWFKYKQPHYKIGGGVGLKLFGNFSKYSYIGFGGTVGIGYYKRSAE